MFTKFTSLIATALIVSGATVYAAPASANNLQAKSEQATTSVHLCLAPGLSNCFDVPVSETKCIDFTGGLDILNKNIDSLIVPGGFICNLYQKFSCTSSTNPVTDEIALVGGSYPSLTAIPTDGNVLNFSNQASSIVCTPFI